MADLTIAGSQVGVWAWRSRESGASLSHAAEHFSVRKNGARTEKQASHLGKRGHLPFSLWLFVPHLPAPTTPSSSLTHRTRWLKGLKMVPLLQLSPTHSKVLHSKCNLPREKQQRKTRKRKAACVVTDTIGRLPFRTKVAVWQQSSPDFIWNLLESRSQKKNLENFQCKTYEAIMDLVNSRISGLTNSVLEACM